ncbi:hypothetical protein AAE478_009659 [Parahypoxylon ruwenzoriense]
MSAYICSPPNTLISSPPRPPASGDYFLTHGQNTSDPAITACCAPNSVNLINDCYLWCEVPPTFANNSANAPAFQECVTQHGGNTTIIVVGVGNTGARTMSLAGSITTAVLVGFLCATY